MATFSSNIEPDGPRTWRSLLHRRNRLLLLAVPASICIVILLYFFMQSYVVDQVEKRVRDAMLECRAFHQYVQMDMHPAYYDLMDERYLPQGFYAPELLSSSYIVRNQQRHYNSERRKEGLPEVEYKMASVDPRNPVNKATAVEQEVIAWFNEDKTRIKYREIIEEDGRKYLLYARPFLEVKQRCLKCHGAPEDAPEQLRDKYHWKGAWNYTVGDIVAAEFVRSPLEGEFNTAAAAIGLAVVALGAGLALLGFNNRLGTLVARRTQALAEERHRFANVIEGTNAGTWDWNVQTGEVVINDKWAQIAGYSKEALAPVTYDDWVDLSHPEDRNETRRLLDKHFADSSTYYENKYRIRHKNGNWIWLHDRGRVIMRSDDGSPLRMYGTSIDVTDEIRIRAEKEKIEAEYHQVQKVESVGRLAGGIAHDLNNLLSPVIGYSEILMQEIEPEDKRRSSAKEILKAGFRARDLVGQLLAFSHKQTLTFEPVNVNNALEGFEALLRRTIRENVELSFTLSPDVQPIMADVGQIEQIVMNLVINAADAMPDGGRISLETGMVDLDASFAALKPGAEPGRYFVLAVSDTGIGMTAEVQEKIFEPFFSTKGQQGTGLGLATVYGIVKQHGGNVWVYSEPGRGTTFKVHFPVADRAANPQDRHDDAEITATAGSEAILLVEDDDQVLQLTRTILERKGYTLFVARDASEALDLLASLDHPLHLLLTDVILPGLNGKELHDEAVKVQPDLKVLYMSGYTDDVIAHHGVLDRGVQFIQKPFSGQNLLLKIREVLEKETAELSSK